ncbi:hypothetical protein Zmor_001895 [Zophobas morio]|uniref:EF-hand domain-containing protein n=1 Tax=Zophobas morio TaxID=2755281 RepID=A0AA38J3F4_9CUCU|nr:hypothetical protein Zmor_001895 [Zophobas morio]
MHCKEIKLTDIWRTCNKIRAAVFRTNLNLWEYFCPLDPNKNSIISESQFISVFSGHLQAIIGLSDQEISELADYFRIQDGRIFYTQLCEVIYDSVPDFSQNAPLISGLEWADPMHVNRLSLSEERRLNLLLTKIACVVNMRNLLLMPYFQDYELISKNNGTVTIGHFARVLNYLKILVSPDDFNLLLKKYLKDSYTVNYIAFIAAIDEIVKYLDKHGVMDLSGDVLSLFPGRIINAELPKLPRPEMGKLLASSIFGKQSIFHSSLTEPKQTQDLLTTIKRIQRHVLENRLRVEEFFKDFDALNSGRLTVSQFHRGLDILGISGIQRLYLSLPEIEAIMIQYQDPCDPTRVCWKTFEDDINQVFTTKELEKYPCLELDVPPLDVIELPRMGGKDWQKVNTVQRELCEEAVDKVKKRVTNRRIVLKPSFRDYDKHNNGYVSRAQMRQSLLSNGILLSDEELYALEERFNNEVGFNYFWFLKEVEPSSCEQRCPGAIHHEVCGKEYIKKPIPRAEQDIVRILAKIKGKVVKERIRVMEFLRDFDKCNQQVISREDFARGLSVCRFDLTENEMKTLMEVFASPLRRECVDYRRFSDVVEEAFTQLSLERAPLIVPLQHLPIKDGERNFLNFDERRTLSCAMRKLSKKPEMELNLMSIFQDYDKTNCGTVSAEHFERALSLRGLLSIISREEFDAVCKCFSYERGMRDEVDYRAFVKGLNIMNNINKYKPF